MKKVSRVIIASLVCMSLVLSVAVCSFLPTDGGNTTTGIFDWVVEG